MTDWHLHFSVNESQAGRTVRDVLQTGYGISRRLLIRAKQNGAILVNGEPVFVTRQLHEGDRVSVTVTEEAAESIPPQPMPLAIRHEDEDILVLAKPAGLVVHPTRTHPDNTLANGVIAHWLARGEQRPFRPVNRLDKDTSGLMIVAKNQWAHEQFARMQKNGTLRRTYQAVVHGYLADDEGVVDAPIGLAEGSIIQRAVRPDGQPARTRWRVLARGAEMTWVELVLKTGRTHQIRVHMSHLGHPLAGDDLYGGSRERIGRQALHAVRLTFSHPRTGETMTFVEPLPGDIARLVETLGR